MRFPHLPIGQRFSFKGRTYTKTGPLTASEEESGRSRLIVKSAEVTPLELSGQPVSDKREQFSRAEVTELFLQYRAELRHAVLARAEDQASLPWEDLLELIDAHELPFDGN
ncbi:MAG: polysulfide reductase chain A [Pseudomonadota bacterium]